MITCTSTRQGIHTQLIDYHRMGTSDIEGLFAKKGIRQISQSKALRAIERFVDDVIHGTGQAFIPVARRSTKNRLWITGLGRQMLRVLPLVGMFDSQHDYAEKPYAFLDACWLIERTLGLSLVDIPATPELLTREQAEALNMILEKIRHSARQDWFKRAVSDRRYQSAKRSERLASYVAGLLYRYSRLLLVRVDLCYPEEMRLHLTIDQLYADLRAFLALRWTHACFKDLKGYAWAVEDGGKKGPHCHLLLIFDGIKVREDITRGRMACDLWEHTVTLGKGKPFNCNARKHQYDEIGIGMISRTDLEACARAVCFATYLTKDPHRPEENDPQYLRIKPPGADAFGTGEHDVTAPRAGRPLIHPITWVPDDLKGIRWPDRRYPSQTP